MQADYCISRQNRRVRSMIVLMIVDMLDSHVRYSASCFVVRLNWCLMRCCSNSVGIQPVMDYLDYRWLGFSVVVRVVW